MSRFALSESVCLISPRRTTSSARAFSPGDLSIRQSAEIVAPIQSRPDNRQSPSWRKSDSSIGPTASQTVAELTDRTSVGNGLNPARLTPHPLLAQPKGPEKGATA
ncbi:unnamed protein product [Protopolystoma xenopodis]|uniref:Uncharacterized protein n=1 Tax=Protopolystoma xenopodis TaxID=117903 RepID=A0A448XS04_9PLAT|nr:unnamed protein product [Protopolystoma xenopodis]